MRGHEKITGLLAAGLSAAVLAGCSGGGSASSAPTSPTSSVGSTGGGTASPSPTETSPASPSPAGVSPTPSTDGTSGSAGSSSAAMLRPGARGAAVLALQRRLTDLGYWLGTPDGHYGDLTVQAVLALQKVAGIGRDGVVGPRTRAVLDTGVRPAARSTSGHVVEIDLAHQVMLVVDDGSLRRVLNVSTGSGAWYTAPDGHHGHAVTPRGHYTIFRSVDGWDTSPLGHLYRPRYFNGGVAVHGYTSVPAYAASHGCVRVSLPAMDMIWREGVLPKGATVWVY